MPRINFYRLDLNMRECYKRVLGPFRFSACPCGCTSRPGVGLNLGLFGVNIQF